MKKFFVADDEIISNTQSWVPLSAIIQRRCSVVHNNTSSFNENISITASFPSSKIVNSLKHYESFLVRTHRSHNLFPFIQRDKDDTPQQCLTSISHIQTNSHQSRCLQPLPSCPKDFNVSYCFLCIIHTTSSPALSVTGTLPFSILGSSSFLSLPSNWALSFSVSVQVYHSPFLFITFHIWTP